MSDRDDHPGAAPKEDVLFVHSPSEDGEGLRVVRKRDDAIEVGELRALAEGKPAHGDIVKLTQREGAPRLFDVEVMVRSARKEPPATDVAARTGPAQVASAAYRRNWEAIFGPRPEDELN
jgi:hypothetical protein